MRTRTSPPARLTVALADGHGPGFWQLLAKGLERYLANGQANRFSIRHGGGTKVPRGCAEAMA